MIKNNLYDARTYLSSPGSILAFIFKFLEMHMLICIKLLFIVSYILLISQCKEKPHDYEHFGIIAKSIRTILISPLILASTLDKNYCYMMLLNLSWTCFTSVLGWGWVETINVFPPSGSLNCLTPLAFHIINKKHPIPKRKSKN